jgi:hypothetical protein
MSLTRDEPIAQSAVNEPIARSFIVIRKNRITHKLKPEREYNWVNLEERVPLATIGCLINEGDCSPKRMNLELRVPNDRAGIVIFRDDRAGDAYFVAEYKVFSQNITNQNQEIGNATSLQVHSALCAEWTTSILSDTNNAHPAMERTQNRRDNQDRVPSQPTGTTTNMEATMQESTGQPNLSHPSRRIVQ